jgi:predicted TPR repeat methyltransferase
VNSPTAPLPTIDGIIDQRAYLVERARGLRVVHLGCVDDGLTDVRAGTGLLLHEELARTARELTGVDVSEEGIARLEQIVPGGYVVGDVENLEDLDLPEVDLVIAAEVIEHLASPGLFLDGLRVYLEKSGAAAIVTTPSAFSWRALVTLIFSRRDRVHPDHLLVYSPVTFVTALERAGLEVTSFRIHAGSERQRSFLGRVALILDRIALRINPFLGIGMVVEVVPSQRHG